MSYVQSVIAAYPTDCQPTHVEPLGSAGGMSGAQFWRLTTPRGLLALRLWPAEFPPVDRLRFIHGVVRHAASRGCEFLPVPVTTRAGESFVKLGGYLWEIAPWMPGQADYHDQPTLEKLTAAMRALAQFHVAIAEFPFQEIGGLNATPAPLRHLLRLRALNPAQFRELSSAIFDDLWPELAPTARALIEILPAAVPRAMSRLDAYRHSRLPMQPCLRDVWHDHILFTGNAVSGLIDFGAIDIDTPATDIARLLGSLAISNCDRLQTWEDGLAAYNTLRPISSDESGTANALDLSSPILAGYNWIRWIYVDRREFDNREQVQERIKMLLARIQRNSDL